MARPATRQSRVSVGWHSSTVSVPGYDAGDTGAVFSVHGPYDLEGAATVTGAQTVTGAVGITGALTATTLGVGGGTTLTNVSLVAETLNFGSVDDHGGASTLTVGISGATYEDLYVVTTPSIWSGLDDTLSVTARSGDTTGEVDIVCVNSGFTARDATEGTFIVMRVGF